MATVAYKSNPCNGLDDVLSLSSSQQHARGRTRGVFLSTVSCSSLSDSLRCQLEFYRMPKASSRYAACPIWSTALKSAASRREQPSGKHCILFVDDSIAEHLDVTDDRFEGLNCARELCAAVCARSQRDLEEKE
jgi:hypothetical protein